MTFFIIKHWKLLEESYSFTNLIKNETKGECINTSVKYFIPVNLRCHVQTYQKTLLLLNCKNIDSNKHQTHVQCFYKKKYVHLFSEVMKWYRVHSFIFNSEIHKLTHTTIACHDTVQSSIVTTIQLEINNNQPRNFVLMLLILLDSLEHHCSHNLVYPIANERNQLRHQ